MADESGIAVGGPIVRPDELCLEEMAELGRSILRQPVSWKFCFQTNRFQMVSRLYGPVPGVYNNTERGQAAFALREYRHKKLEEQLHALGVNQYIFRPDTSICEALYIQGRKVTTTRANDLRFLGEVVDHLLR